MGRPPLPPDEVRDQILQLRTTSAERTLLEAAAGRADATFAEWARPILLQAAKRSGSATRTARKR